MKEIKFLTCMGETVEEPDLQYIISLIKLKGPEYWSSGAGQSLIQYADEKKISELYLMMSESNMFYLEYYKDKKYYVYMSSNTFNEIEEIYVGGDPLPIPRALLLSIEDTINQVDCLLKTGEVCFDNNKWIEKAKIDWHYGENPNAREYSEPVCKNINDIIKKHSKIKKRWMKE